MSIFGIGEQFHPLIHVEKFNWSGINHDDYATQSESSAVVTRTKVSPFWAKNFLHKMR
jgi:hypothetical protein